MDIFICNLYLCSIKVLSLSLSLSLSMTINGQDCSNTQVIAEHFNTFFATIGAQNTHIIFFFKRKMYMNFFKRISININNHVCNVHSLGDI